jgi:REP element-mobilizing transposase RayT
MGRTTRLHHPGSAFHIVSRTQGHEPWITDDVKDVVAEILLTGVASAGARPVAFAVMDTHFHLILFQGTHALGWTMQSILRRIALLLQRRHNLEGHVFERRYRAKLCSDREYLPNAILYVHRNPVKAEVCRRASDYRWSSARAYEGLCATALLAVDAGHAAFDPDGTANAAQCREAYIDRLKHTSADDLDEYWSWFWRAVRRRRNASTQLVPTSRHVQRPALRDLRDVALVLLKSIDKDADPRIVRSRYGGPRIVEVRKQLIAALSQRGYEGVKIAEYLCISQTTVSKVRSAMRWASIKAMAEAAERKEDKQVR